MLTCILALVISPTLFAQDDKKAAEEEARKKLDEFRAVNKKSKSDVEIVKAIEELGKVQHKIILQELKGLLKKSKEVAGAAAAQLGKYSKDKEAAEALMAAAEGAKDKDQAIRFIRCAAETRYRGIGSRLCKFYGRSGNELDLAREALEASAKVKSKDCITPLIGIVKELENIDPKPTSPSDSKSDLNQSDTITRKRELLPAARTALQAITGESLGTGREYELWWGRNRDKFKELD